ncbi:hypothetical protein ILUMI_25367 [Ignelater luminosus]|uniref:PiggyBac transposable element-derived protein domain-containing protein n=1 Tax=Ignelater luminosus TaxID=2038154 RepID=A0A8K0CBV1_IGNLU|nr:hypothetical protein ILUMI_25367 [Ignelater luminosus]
MVPGVIEIHQIDSDDDEDEDSKVGIRDFLLFWTLEIISDITEQTNLYARRDKNDHSFMVTEEDICQFLGLILISGYP